MSRANHRYTNVAIFLHWGIAVLIIVNIVIGLDFNDPLPGERFSKKPLLPLHVSIGFTVLVLSVFRLVWRLMHKAPDFPATTNPWEARFARWAHACFYFLIIALPVSGWLIQSAHKVYGTPLMVYGLFDWPRPSIIQRLSAEQIHHLHELFVDAHRVLGSWIMIAMIALHVGAVAKHHLIDRDPILRRMTPLFRRGSTSVIGTAIPPSGPPPSARGDD